MGVSSRRAAETSGGAIVLFSKSMYDTSLEPLSYRYGESEKLLADVFKAAEKLGGAILFFDEIDSLATAR